MMSKQYKGARSDRFIFFQTFWKFGIRRKLILFFLITPGEFSADLMYRLEDINEIVTSYGNHD